MSLLSRATWAAERVIYAASSAVERVAAASRPSSIQIRQLPTSPQSAWSVDNIRGALEQHELGDFQQSAKLVQAFGRDERISACRNTRIRALVGKSGASFDVTASDDGDQRRAGVVAAQMKKQWFRTTPEDTLMRIQGDVVDLGVSISRIHWYRELARNGQWLPRLEPWHMEWVRWDILLNCYVGYTAQGPIEIRPGTGEWLIVEPSGSLGYMAGGVRALGMPFFFRRGTWTDWARYCEKHGVPILAIDEPPNEPGALPGDKNTKARFFESLRKIGREGILRLPKQTKEGKGGFDARIIEPRSLSWPAFKAFLERLDTCIAVYLLGQNLSTEVQSGSLAAAIAQNRIRLDYLAADAEGLSTALREQVWKPWGRFNFDWWDDAIAAWPRWDIAIPEDLKAKGATINSLGAGLANLRLIGMPYDVRAIGDQFGIPLLSEADAAKEAEARKLVVDTAPAAPLSALVTETVARELAPVHAAVIDQGGRIDQVFARLEQISTSIEAGRDETRDMLGEVESMRAELTKR